MRLVTDKVVKQLGDSGHRRTTRHIRLVIALTAYPRSESNHTKRPNLRQCNLVAALGPDFLDLSWARAAQWSKLIAEPRFGVWWFFRELCELHLRQLYRALEERLGIK
jgi:hypothetical protein